MEKCGKNKKEQKFIQEQITDLEYTNTHFKEIEW